MDWPDRYAAALELELTDDEIDTILDLARDVAHATERRWAPVSAYLAGRYVAGQVERGTSPSAALEQAAEVARRLATPNA